MKRNVFIIGSKGIPAQYGGFETFVDKLTQYVKSSRINFYVSCLSNSENENEFIYNGATCFTVKVPNIGGAKAILYDLKSLEKCIDYIEKNKLENCIIYILACRIGPFMYKYKKKLENLNVRVYINPDGHEWKRAKWSWYVKKYWKLSERLMVKYADQLICDSKCIEDYIKEKYKRYKPKTLYISYGAELGKSVQENDSQAINAWYAQHQITENEYYLMVGRFVPENNYEFVIKEYMVTDTKKDLVIITNVENNRFYSNLLKKTNFNRDRRIKFVGSVYNSELLRKIRENAFAYIHGHEVGGTNPSLLEALASTKLNIVFDVPFNREVAEEAAIYFNKKDGYLKNILEEIERWDNEKIKEFDMKAKERISRYYSWDKIAKEYERLFLNSL